MKKPDGGKYLPSGSLYKSDIRLMPSDITFDLIL